MSQDREDDEAARQRIAALESALRQRDAELAAQRAELRQQNAELQHLKHERASSPDPRELAEPSDYVVPARPAYVPPSGEPSPYAAPGEPSPYAPPNVTEPMGPVQHAPLSAAIGLIFATISHIVSVFGVFLGFASCMSVGTSCDDAQAQGHATFIDSAWGGFATAIFALVLGAYTLRKVSRLGVGYRRGLLSVVFGATGVIASMAPFLLAALSAPEPSKNPTNEPWWTPKKLPDHWF
ncbi:MAG: bZIP transcription factor [Polyangiaceae bacterium]